MGERVGVGSMSNCHCHWLCLDAKSLCKASFSHFNCSHWSPKLNPCTQLKFLEFKPSGVYMAYCDLNKKTCHLPPPSALPMCGLGQHNNLSCSQEGGMEDTADTGPWWEFLPSCGEVPWWAPVLLPVACLLFPRLLALFPGSYVPVYHPLPEHIWSGHSESVPSLLASSWCKMKAGLKIIY